MDHQLRRTIILKLIHNPRMSYNQLWDKQGDSNLFAYHLKKLEEEGVVAKHDDGYGLTQEGRKLSTFIEGDTGGRAELITPTVIIMLTRTNENGETMVLGQERLKEPFYGYWSFPSGKINMGWNPMECAVRDLKEETDLEAHDMKIRCIEYVKTYDNGKLLHHHILWNCQATQFTGTLKEHTHKARNKWMTVAEYKASKRFPGTWLVDIVIPSKEFFMIEAERYMTNGVFTDKKVVRVQKFSEQ
jgi:ADP-ribose pyrophosphatase YjhB (NUDIX family)